VIVQHFRIRRSVATASTETDDEKDTTALKAVQMIRRKQTPNKSYARVPATESDKGIGFSQVSCMEYIDHSFDSALEEVSDSAQAEKCEFLDLEEVADRSAEGSVRSTGSNRPNQAAEHVASDKPLAEISAAVADIPPPVDDAFDADDEEDDIEIERCHISILNTPKFLIDQKSCSTTPASTVNWINLDINDDTLSLLGDEQEGDENVLPDDASLRNQSELKNPAYEYKELPSGEVRSALLGTGMKLQSSLKKSGRKEVDEEQMCTPVISGCDTDVEDPVDDGGPLILLSDREKANCVESTAVKVSQAVAYAGYELTTAGQSFLPLFTPQSSAVDNVTATWIKEQAADFHVQLIAPEQDTEANRRDDFSVIGTQMTSIQEKSTSRKKKAMKQSKSFVDGNEASLLKSAGMVEEFLLEDFVLQQSMPKCHFSPQHTSVVECIKESGLSLEAFESQELTAINRGSHHQPQNSIKLGR